MLRPIRDFAEMDVSDRTLIARLSAVDAYVRSFAWAFPEDAARGAVTVRNVSRALAGYLRTVLSGDTPIDRFANGSDTLPPLVATGFDLSP